MGLSHSRSRDITLRLHIMEYDSGVETVIDCCRLFHT